MTERNCVTPISKVESHALDTLGVYTLPDNLSCRLTFDCFCLPSFYVLLGTLRSNDADDNENVKKPQFRTCITLFCTFISRFCTTATRKCLISRFMEDVNKQRRNFISLFKLGYGPLKFSFRRVRLQLAK